MDEKILFVDDEENLLNGIKRNLGKYFNIETALSGKKGIEIIAEKGPFAVIISDMRMPEMNGIEFLTLVKNNQGESIRMMLTGNADLETAINAVNEGNIFRFLSKPCSPDLLKLTVEAGLKQYRLIRAEKELLEKTLNGSIKILFEILSIANPTAFRRASHIVHISRRIVKIMKITKSWEIEIAAMLSQIGCIALTETLLKKIYDQSEISENEKKMIESGSKIGYELIKKIPRMEIVAEIIAYQEKHFDGTGIPTDQRKGKDIPLGARILKAALDYDILFSSRKSNNDILLEIKTREGWYDPDVLKALVEIIALREEKIQIVKTHELKLNMILLDDVVSNKGVLLIPKGQEVSTYLIERLKNYENNLDIKLNIKVTTT